MIVTTNFDRLLESALESAGVSPLVIATADQAAGAPPLAHNQCTIIKVHGDYLDTRIRNSDAELTAYEPELDALLDRVFDEYGLIVCGWSGEYDAGLRAVIERCKSRRYTTYWCAHGSMSAAALSETSLALTANGSFWGESRHDDSWLRTVRRLAEVDVPRNGVSVWLALYRYPALLHLYGAGIAAVAAHRYDLLAALLQRPVRSLHDPEDQAIVRVLYPHEVIEAEQAHILFPHPNAPRQKYQAPLSHYPESVIRPTFADLIPSDQDYADAFDRFERLACLVHQDLFGFRIEGLFVWRGRIWQLIKSEIDDSPGDWHPLRAGLFSGSVERLVAARGAVDKDIAQVRRW